jgi:hypothetical protein
MDKNLYIILPYYNYFDNEHRVSNISRFIETYRKIDNCKIVVVEGLTAESKPLKDLSDKIFKHIKYNIPQKIWVKENLINLVLKNHLPEDYNFFCWLDCDIFFEDKDWVNHTIDLLRENDAIQMFNFGINQERRIEFDDIPFHSLETAPSFKGHSVSISQIAYFFNFYDTQDFRPHSGYGWGMTKDFYTKIGKLWDYNIIGSGDSIIARSIVQMLTEEQILKRHSLNVLYSEDYAHQILEYYKKFKDCKCSFLPSRIYHFFHGSMKNRLYLERHNILRKLNYDTSMVNYNEDGIIYTNKELSSVIFNYMTFRDNPDCPTARSVLIRDKNQDSTQVFRKIII